MAFDAAFTAAVTSELSSVITGARIDKIFQPSRDSVLLVLRGSKVNENAGRTLKLLIDAGTSNPRICLSDPVFDNPKVPPMFCMLLRKYMSGSKILSVKQLGFERAVELRFETRDEMGFISEKYIYAEIMGKNSNIIFCGQDKKIISAVKVNDLSGTVRRPVIPGMTYTPPIPQQNKISPLDETADGFNASLAEKSGLSVSDFIMSRYAGISPLVARETEYASRLDGDVCGSFFRTVDIIKKGTFVPVLIRKKSDGTPTEYSFMPICQYGSEYTAEICSDFSTLLEKFFSERCRAERIRARAADILKTVSSAQARIARKLAAQKADLDRCADKDKYKKYADLITSDIYRLSRGMTSASVIDYSDENYPTVDVPLDPKLTPAQNAQKYYKKYAKCKSAEINLTKQTELSQKELLYIESVSEALSKAESEDDLNEIRDELTDAGYIQRPKGVRERKASVSKPMEFRSVAGFRILCGKNNRQNDYITHKLASKNDIWFHVKDLPGSHTVLFCGENRPSDGDLDDAANIAAVFSKASKGQKVTVDYTEIKNVKKPPSSPAGFVTFSSNRSAYVTPDADRANSLRVK